jgi:hypothetical protein
MNSQSVQSIIPEKVNKKIILKRPNNKAQEKSKSIQMGYVDFVL